MDRAWQSDASARTAAIPSRRSCLSAPPPRWNARQLAISSAAHETSKSFRRLLGLFMFLFFGAALQAQSSAPSEAPSTAPSATASGRERLSLDRGWRFHLGDIPFPVIAGQQFPTPTPRPAKPGGPRRRTIDDSAWRVARPSARLGGGGAVRPEGQPLPGLPPARHRLVSAAISGSTPPTGGGTSNCNSTASPRTATSGSTASSRPQLVRLHLVLHRHDALRQLRRQPQHHRRPRGRRCAGRVVVRGRGHLPAHLAGEARRRPPRQPTACYANPVRKADGPWTMPVEVDAQQFRQRAARSGGRRRPCSTPTARPSPPPPTQADVDPARANRRQALARRRRAAPLVGR